MIRTESNRALGAVGVWIITDGMSAAEAAEFVQRVEALGYSALWLPESVGRDPFAHIGFLAAHTTKLLFATGIANIFHRHPGAMQQAGLTLAEQTDGRFIMGLGVGHAPMVEGLRKLDYSKPRSQMRHYIEGMESSPYRGPRPTDPFPRLLGALGPRMLALASDVTEGAHSYFATPEHTAQAREILGPGKLLCVEQKVILESDPNRARDTARSAMHRYATLPNYRQNWIRLGYDEAEIEQKSDRLVDGLVAWGSEQDLHDRVQAHYGAGASHVCIQPLNPFDSHQVDWRTLEALAPNNA